MSRSAEVVRCPCKGFWGKGGFAALLFVPMSILAGCAATEGGASARELKTDTIFAYIKVVDSIKDQPNALAYTSCVANICVIEILKSEYPRCITHEIRHGFEGDWHAGIETDEDCDEARTAVR